MLNIAGAAALLRTDDLRVEIKKALAKGVTADEVRDILGQVALHADSSLADCVRVAEQVLADLEISAPATSWPGHVFGPLQFRMPQRLQRNRHHECRRNGISIFTPVAS